MHLFILKIVLKNLDVLDVFALFCCKIVFWKKTQILNLFFSAAAPCALSAAGRLPCFVQICVLTPFWRRGRLVP